jgi:hypothetical protein
VVPSSIIVLLFFNFNVNACDPVDGGFINEITACSVTSKENKLDFERSIFSVGPVVVNSVPY